MKNITLEFWIAEEELEMPACDYIFKYIIGFSSGLLESRAIRTTENPLRFFVDYTFK